MNKLILSVFIYLFTVGCYAQKTNYLVMKITDDKCLDLFYRLKLKNITSDMVFNVVSKKSISDQIEIKKGDTISVSLKKIERTDKEVYSFDIVRGGADHYCDGELLLSKDESFYRTKDLEGLHYVEEKKKCFPIKR